MYNDNLSYFSFDDIIIDVFICYIVSCNILICFIIVFSVEIVKLKKVAEINKWNEMKKWNRVHV